MVSPTEQLPTDNFILIGIQNRIFATSQKKPTF